MTENELIEEINAELTNSCSIPYELPRAEVKRIIKRAREFMWDNYQYAVEEGYMQIPKAVFDNSNFRKFGRKICLPENVKAVTEFAELKGGGVIPHIDPDFSDSKLFGTEIFLAPFQGDNLVYRTALFAYYDLAQAYVLDSIAYSFNKNTRKLFVKGRDPRRDCYVRVELAIPEDDLYADELFIRYCLAQAKIQLGRILSIYEFNLPGGVRINFDAIRGDGEKELEDIKQQIDDENTPDWFYQFRV
jgi:hypothetical protein